MSDAYNKVHAAICSAEYEEHGFVTTTRVFAAVREPDPHAVAAVADALKMDATKVAAVWMLMIDEALK